MSKGNRSYAVKRTATGLSLFASTTLPAGTQIIEYTGPLITSEEVTERKTGKYFFGIDDKYSVDGSPRSNLARYINHSCQPNAEAIISDRQIWIWSTQAIPAGEEMTINYGQDYFADHIKPVGCKCKKCMTRPNKKKRR